MKYGFFSRKYRTVDFASVKSQLEAESVFNGSEEYTRIFLQLN